MNHNHYCVIMAGGSGRRFWPISREDRPTQFLHVADMGRTLLDLTFERFAKIVPEENILVVTLEKYADAARGILPRLRPENLILEPYSRGTAPCMAYAAYTLMKRNPDAVIVATPSDQVIRDDYLFERTINNSFAYVEEHDVLMTLGIVPRSADVNFGYIQVKEGKDAYLSDKPLKVKTFTEKPDEELAKVFFRTGEFFWNSGVFVWSAKAICREMEKYLPEVTSQFAGWEQAIGTPEESAFIQRSYGDCPKVSLDYGVMERTDEAWLYPAKFGWTDVGSWEALYRLIPEKDSYRNAVNTFAHILDDCTDSIVISKHKDKLLAVKGLKDYIVVDTPDALLICPKDEKVFHDFMAGIAMPDYEKYR